MGTKVSYKMRNGMKKACSKIVPKLGAQKGDQKRAKGKKRKRRVEKVRPRPTFIRAGRSGRRLTCPSYRASRSRHMSARQAKMVQKGRNPATRG